MSQPLKRPITGQGVYQYEVIHDWGALPSNIEYGNTHGVCEDSQGRIYVFHTVGTNSLSADALVVFDSDGKFVKSWGSEFAGGAHGLHLQKEGSEEFLYLSDIKRCLVVKTTLDGELAYTLGCPRESPEYPLDASGAPAAKYIPTNVAVAPNGDVYVADGYGSSFINQYNKDGKFLRTFGGVGSAAGQLDCPHGLMVDTRGSTPYLLVADRKNNRLQSFSLEGTHLGFAYGVNLPCHFQARQGTLLIPDLASRVTLMDSGDQVLVHLGEGDATSFRELRKHPREKFIAGQFVAPHGACFDHEGNIFVVEWVEVGRVTKLRRVG
jgi:hypothetical protein